MQSGNSKFIAIVITIRLGATEGSGYSDGGVEVDSGIKTPAPETKVE